MKKKDIYAVIEPFIYDLQGLVRIAQANPTYELEARLVDQSLPSRPAHVPKEQFGAIYAFFKRSEKVFVKQSKDWDHSLIHFFKDSWVRNTSRKDESEWINKIPLVDYNYNVEGREFGFRVSLREESKADPIQAPVHLIRSRKRYSFWLPTFRLDFSIVWTGKSPEEVKHVKPTYEIEVEYLVTEEEIHPSKIAGDFLIRILELQGMERPCKIQKC